MSMEFFAISEAGPRPNNEDCAKAWRLGDGSVCLAVADGLGGRGSGGVASSTALAMLIERIGEFPKSSNEVVRVFKNIHQEIVDRQKDADQHRFMATTLTAVFLHENMLLGAHAGDTRAMIARGNGIKRLTIDHSEAQRLLDEGKIDNDQFLDYPRKHILESALGAEQSPRIDELEFDLLIGDRVFVTSDGFHSKLPLRPMLSKANEYSDPKSFALNACELVGQLHPDDNYSIAVSYV